MSKFKAGDRIRCVVQDSYKGVTYYPGDVIVVTKECEGSGLFFAGPFLGREYLWELAPQLPNPKGSTYAS